MAMKDELLSIRDREQSIRLMSNISNLPKFNYTKDSARRRGHKIGIRNYIQAPDRKYILLKYSTV